MKVTRTQLRQFIRESIMLEGGADPDLDVDIDPAGPEAVPWWGTGVAPWKTNVANTPAKALTLVVLKKLGPMSMSKFDPEDVIEMLNELGYDIVSTSINS